VRVHATARLSGTIRYETLNVESGSEITASCEKAKAG
jgi:cytoskeletal protein CcmA (bactofilin family)